MVRPAVNLEINARDRTRQAFDTASRRIDDLTGGATKLNRLFAGGLGVAVVGTAISGLSRAVQQAVADLDAIGKAARNAGTDAETLQGIQQFADRAGVGLRAANIAMQRFTRRVGDAVDGTGTLNKVFKELGIDVRDANGNVRSTIEILGDYQRALQNAGSEAEQSKLAFAAFDSEGVGFGLGLARASESIDTFIERAHEMGVIVDNETIKAAEDLTDNMTALGEVIRADVTNALGPFIGALGTLTDNLLVLRGIANETVATRVAFDGLEAAIGRIGNTGADFGGIIDSNTAALVALELELNNARNAVDELSGAEQIAALEELNQHFLRAQQALADAGEADSDLYQRVRAAAQAVRDTLKEVRTEQEQIADDAEATAKYEAAIAASTAEHAEWAKEVTAEFNKQTAAGERAAKLEEARKKSSLAAIEAETLRLRQAAELVGLSGEDLLLTRQRHEVERLMLRIQEAQKKERQDEVDALEKLLEQLRLKHELERDTAAVKTETKQTSADQNDLLKEQRDIYGEIEGLLRGIGNEAADVVAVLIDLIRVWRQVGKQGDQAQGGGALGATLSAVGGAFGGGGIQLPAAPQQPAGGAVGDQRTFVSELAVTFHGVDYGRDFRERAIEAADVIYAGQQDFIARNGG